MENLFDEIELDLLNLMYPVPNYPNEQRELWRKLRNRSAAPREILDRIETMLPGGRFHDKNGSYACDGAAFFAMIPSLDSPLGLQRTDHSALLDSLIRIDGPETKKLTLMCFYENRQTPEPEFHFAIDLDLDIKNKVAFHKPGFNPAWLTFAFNITEQYRDYRVVYFARPIQTVF